MNTTAYAVFNKNDKIRLKSSSGAVFYEMARRIILNDGVVCGAKYDASWSIVHGHTDIAEEIEDFLGSKYVQSDILDEYRAVERNLKTGRAVLFSGTPCQVAGLKCFLGRDYSNLITVDFICHGVPSPLVWQQYILKISKGRTITGINFRDKTEGWLQFSLKIDFNDGSCYRKTRSKDLYMQGFLQNIYLRPSCYQCRFKGIERTADITLADFWGVKKVLPKMFDDKGTSMILIHSKIGNDLWEEVKNAFQYCEIETENIERHNVAAVTSSTWPIKRNDFFSSGEDKFYVLERIIKDLSKKRTFSKLKHALKKPLGKNEFRR